MLSNSAGRTGNCDLGPDPTLSTRVAQRMVKRRRRAQGRDPPPDTTPADLRKVILVIGDFLLALFFVTKLALGL